MHTFVDKLLRALAVLSLVALCASGAQARTSLLVYDFDLDMQPAENVDFVRALGFRGLVTRLGTPDDVVKLGRYARHVATLDDFRLLAYVAHDFSKPASLDVWRDALPLLAEAGAPLWVIVKKAPSDAAMRELLGRMARTAAAQGVRVVVYPHWNTSIETAAEAAALIDEVGHPNLRNSLHTCHEIRGGNQYALEQVVAEHADETALVAIAGAAENAYVGPPGPFVTWADVIKPLDQGDFSLASFLQALHDAGYDGPVLLQTFGIDDDGAHLRRSIAAYAEYTAQVTADG